MAANDADPVRLAQPDPAALEQRAIDATGQMVRDILDASRKAWPAYFDLFMARLGAARHEQLAHAMVCALDAALASYAKPETTEGQITTGVVEGFGRALSFYRESQTETDLRVRDNAARTGSMLQ